MIKFSTNTEWKSVSRLIYSWSRRTLFRKLKKLEHKPVKENDDEFYHEYSIRPDTFAFKVSTDGRQSSNSFSNNSTEKKNEVERVHPLQQSSGVVTNNILDYIYRNATNYPFREYSPEDIYNRYPFTNSKKLSKRAHPPKKVKLRTSDFIEDALYNPQYGYFSKEVEIFHPDKPFDYGNIRDIDEFLDSWKNMYMKYDTVSLYKQGEADFKENIATSSSNNNSKLANRAVQLLAQENKISKRRSLPSKRSLQLWHTPTELFQPYYGEAIARYVLVNYKLNGNYPYEDLIIYEMGGGNGTLMCNILNYIKEHQPDIYHKTQYKIIEILSQLADKQITSALETKLIENGLDKKRLEVVNKSIFDWDIVVEQPCFFIALEVFDNFAHDLIRYDISSGEPYEGRVLIDEHGDFYEFFDSDLSYYTDLYLRLRENGRFSKLAQLRSIQGKLDKFKSTIPFLTNKDSIHPLLHSQTKLRWKNNILPFKDNMSPGEFVPTRLLQFFHILRYKFPRHSLIASDFYYLPNTIPGYYNAPVVQTILQNKMVDITTYMSLQGYFDIMFPTDFEIASELYTQVTGKVSKIETHREFLEIWSDIEATTTKKGENPMLDFYTNVNFLIS